MPLILLTISISFILSAYFYSLMPAEMVTHWNVLGQADGYSSKEFGLFLFPVLLTVLSILLMVLPKMDPFRKNVQKFWNTYMGFVAVMGLFFLYLQILVIQWNRGFIFNFLHYLLPAFTVLFYTTGILMEKSKRNSFIGIRTPWTLASDAAWDKTHKLGGKLFKTAGVLMLIGMFAPDYSFIILFCVILAASLIPVVYSYVIFRY